MNKIQDLAGFFFIAAIGVLSAISVLGVWDFFGEDVIFKSFQTVGILAVVAAVVMVAGRFFGGRAAENSVVVAVPNPIFTSLRRMTLALLVVSASLLALLGILAVWDIITDKEVLFKSLGSLAIIAFGSFVIVATCLQREGSKLLKSNISGAFLVVVIVLGALLLRMFMFWI